MATISHTKQHVGTQAKIATWAGITENDVGDSVYAPSAAEKSVQIEGTFGGSTVPIEGSVDGVNYRTLSDVGGTPIAVTAAGIHTIRDNVAYVRAGTPTGGTSVSVNVSLLYKQVN